MGAGLIRAVLVAGAIAVVLAPSALGASPQQIYADLADNGRLDRQYAKADLQAALRSAVVQVYPEGTVQEELVAEIAAAGEEEGVLPFTGLDLVLLVGVGLTMLLVGTGLRRLRARPED